MVRLSKPWKQSLSKEDFEEYPIWVWDDENEGRLPLSELSYDYGTLFVKSHFYTGGYTFEGYVVGITSFYAFCIFLHGDFFIFNMNLSIFFQPEIDKIFQILKCPPFPFFPVHFKTDVHLKEGEQISGTFEFHPYTFT